MQTKPTLVDLKAMSLANLLTHPKTQMEVKPTQVLKTLTTENLKNQLMTLLMPMKVNLVQALKNLILARQVNQQTIPPDPKVM